MRVAVSWLAEYVDLSGVSTEQLDAAMVRQGLEVEEIHEPQVTGPVVLGQVQKITELTEFKKPIRHCLVDVGESEPRSIVCGARNFSEGSWVIVALPGAVLPGDFAIQTRQTYGHLSDGMICSAPELGLSTAGGDKGIIVLNIEMLSDNAHPGADALNMLGINDTVIELAITPDRGYCLALRGVAREVAHALQARYRDPGYLPADRPVRQAYPIQINDPTACDRFVARVVRGIDGERPTPWWMISRLNHAGIRSISLSVDVTNYVMLELGQPLHAFDLNALRGPITVRRGQSGEKLRTLDDVERAVRPEDVLITDERGPIGFAGVMGGENTEVNRETTDVLLEGAHWDPVSIAATARYHKLPSEAAKRFERNVDPEMAEVATLRAAQLLTQLGGGELDESLTDIDTRTPLPTITLSVHLPSRISGVPYTPEQVEARLREIGCVVTVHEDILAVTPPSWRSDLTEESDLVEEVIRLEGYDEIPSILPLTPASSGLSVDQQRRRHLSNALADRGFVEVLSDPFVSADESDAFRLPAADPRRSVLRLSNPLAETEPYLRSWLLPGVISVARRNLSRGARSVQIFEVSAVYDGQTATRAPILGVQTRPTDAELATLLRAVPQQPHHVAMVLATGKGAAAKKTASVQAKWAEAIAHADALLRDLGVAYTVTQAEYAPWHPGRCALFSTEQGAVIGYAGELHPAALANLKLPERTCAVELDLSVLGEPVEPEAPVISQYPPVLLDVALVVNGDVPTADVRDALLSGAGEYCESCELFDVYTGEQIGASQRSLAYALSFRASDRTLTVEEAVAYRDAAVGAARRAVGAHLRE